ncbi:MAG: NAD(P)-dependent glycerol-1-phosphate dehydrogenase [Crenarchaeota archaeon]|nr:NAD(P)-dependent glycerol-1-phosphate dehydrogenase [Thermoproteota archaeon]
MSGPSIHTIELPKKIVVGEGVVAVVGTVLRELGLDGRILVVTGPHVYRLYGGELEEALKSKGYTDYVFVIAERPSLDEAARILRKAREIGARIIIGFGGGKAIDLAKYTAYKLSAFFVSVPTSASHDGIASPFASLKGLGKPHSVRAATPLAVVADVSIIARAPQRLLKAGAGDLVAKLTAVRDWRLAHRLKGEYYGEYAASLALLSAKHVIRYSDIIAKGGVEAARIVVEGLISSGVAMCIAGSTRPASGSEHLFSHALDLVAPRPALHGEQVAVGTIMMMYLHGGRWLAVRRTLKRIGLPVNARELGIEERYIVKALVLAHRIRPERYTILGETGLTPEAAEKLARVTRVIE